MPPSFPPLADIPDFRLIKPIGSGSYGEVWLARSVTGAYRAIKIVRRDQFDCEKSFEREFRGIEAFEPVSRTHANLLQVLHVGRNAAAGFYFYVMELADDAAGAPISDPDAYVPKTLRSLVRTGTRLAVSDAIRIGRELASGLAHLHGLGLVHRDIKPSNIVYVNGVAKLGDAGLVARSREDMSLVGTEGYVPPEGMGRPPADLYSLGMVLYEMSTGRCRQDFPEIPTDLPSREDKELFMQLNAVVLKACDPNPARRFKTASHLLTALNGIQTEKRGFRRGFSRRLFVRTALMILLLLLALVFTTTTRTRCSAENRREAPENKHPAIVEPPSSPATKRTFDNVQPLEPNTKGIQPPTSEPRVADPNGNTRDSQQPVPGKTIITDEADQFFRP